METKNATLKLLIEQAEQAIESLQVEDDVSTAQNKKPKPAAAPQNKAKDNKAQAKKK